MIFLFNSPIDTLDQMTLLWDFPVLRGMFSSIPGLWPQQSKMCLDIVKCHWEIKLILDRELVF